MANWPRVIVPEDRIKYLIQARHDFKDDAKWERSQDGHIYCVTLEEEYLNIIPNQGVFEAWYQMADMELLVGEFDNAIEARKALTDHVVVAWAMKQAWEDVAS